MATWYYSFQLSRVHPIELRSQSSSDVNLITFGILVNARDHGHGSAIVPVFRDQNIGGAELTNQSVGNGFVTSLHFETGMSRDWRIGPVEVDDDDGVIIVLSGTNTNDNQLPTADQQQMDELTIKFLNIYYSWLLGNFVSVFGLSEVAEWIGRALPEVAQFLTDPVGKILGYEPQGPCNGMVWADKIALPASELEDLNWAPFEHWSGAMEVATVTRTFDDSIAHDTSRCGPVARTDLDVTIRRTPTWSLRKHDINQPITSVRARYGDLESLKEAAGLRK